VEGSKIEGVEMLSIFVFRVKWDEDEIMLKSQAVGDSIAFEWEGIDWRDLFTG